MDLDQLIAMAYIIGIGSFASTVRYLKELGDNLQTYSVLRHAVYIITGGFVAVMAGFITTHQGMSGQMQFFIVGLAAVSSREILDFVPAAFRRFLQDRTW
jgi:hypothetical protein